ncbi:AgmX/PglI C-terminal domain-containing protein [Myxococcota bacterium]
MRTEDTHVPGMSHSTMVFLEVLALSLLAHLFVVTTLVITPRPRELRSEDLFDAPGEPDRFVQLMLATPNDEPARDARGSGASIPRYRPPAQLPRVTRINDLAGLPVAAGDGRRFALKGKRPARVGVLGILAASMDENALVAISNLEAVRVPGSSSGYRVSGIIARLPGSDDVGGLSIFGRGDGPGNNLSADVGHSRASRLRVSGTLDREDIWNVVSSELPHLRACHDSSGKALLKWTIAADGSVSHVTVRTSLPPTVMRCVRAKVRAWRFPRNGGDVRVSFPVVL